ncbi:MAG: hypothetical protein ACYTFO_07660 [Planctomycetota bacterium]|jgi:transcription-repair coupling factor (superfamily II helicase)
MFERILNNATLVEAAGRLKPGRTIQLAGVWGSSAGLLAAAMGQLADAPVLFVGRHLDDADDLADDVEVLTGQAAELFPAWETDLAADHVSDEVAGERVRICNQLAHPQRGQGAPRFIVAPVMALLQPVPSAQALAAGRLTLAVGDDLGVDALAEWLVDAGYESVDQIDRHGEFARRGGIVDVFVPGTVQAVRVEFFGDNVDSIRLVDLDTARSTDQIDAVDLASLTVGRAATESASLLDYLPAETVICVHEPAEVTELAAQLHDRTSGRDLANASGRLVDPAAFLWRWESGPSSVSRPIGRKHLANSMR